MPRKFWFSLSTVEGMFDFGCLNLKQAVFLVLFNDSSMMTCFQDCVLLYGDEDYSDQCECYA
jgi:hypothetical protein